MEAAPLFALVTIAVLVAVLSWWGHRQLSKLTRRQEEIDQQLRLYQQSITGLTSGALGIDRRLARLEANAKVIFERQETIENQQSDEKPYGRAIHLVEQGASVRRLVEELALSESEAELIVRLHGGQRSA